MTKRGRVDAGKEKLKSEAAAKAKAGAGANLEEEEDDNGGFGAWLRSGEGVTYMHIFVLTNSFFVFLTMLWPQISQMLKIMFLPTDK
ncbi:unnamed protein product [Bemisia tabaci]|uniref:Uncharacterized protein n=1 Tax=Bemisia tabaci TaxID=7038 RepID=A0A9P0AIN9_BEMTA|nr:unnamed protein product [Bemisia tabaci]